MIKSVLTGIKHPAYIYNNITGIQFLLVPGSTIKTQHRVQYHRHPVSPVLWFYNKNTS